MVDELTEADSPCLLVCGARWGRSVDALRSTTIFVIPSDQVSGRHVDTRTLTPSICHEGKLLNTMPKSGSAYVENSLSKILGLWTRYHGHRYGLIDQIDIQDAHTFSRGPSGF